jgi:hypothetical protein
MRRDEIFLGGGAESDRINEANYEIPLKVHMHVLWFVFHKFLASFNNRRGRGPEFQKF